MAYKKKRECWAIGMKRFGCKGKKIYNNNKKKKKEKNGVQNKGPIAFINFWDIAGCPKTRSPHIFV